MPELPEVEAVRLGLSSLLTEQTIEKIIVRNEHLRWPVLPHLSKRMQGAKILEIKRRGKYILLHSTQGDLILHLGMSGRVLVCQEKRELGPHDHIDIIFKNGLILRYSDPRRFGSLIWTPNPAEKHELLSHIGPEPLTSQFNAKQSQKLAQGRKQAIKSFLMDAHIVAGIGNIYANEALFLAGIHPSTPAGKLTTNQMEILVRSCKQVLRKAIKAGGTTLKDFQNALGDPGQFSQQLYVYGQTDKPCRRCNTSIQRLTINQRASFYCPQCQNFRK
jgi:formamidopyrimidine-DNA glycosylase